MSTLLLLALSLRPALAVTAPNETGDVVATRAVQVAPEALYPRLLDLRNLERALAPCTKKWEYGSRTEGVGANASLVYKLKGFRRKLSMTLSKVDEGRKVTFDHAGNKGFVTVWTLTPEGEGARVEVRSYLNMPPWPFRKYYLNEVRPEWEACQDRAIQTIAEGAGAR